MTGSKELDTYEAPNPMDSGLFGDLANIRIRLSGLGFAGEYACIIRRANGFATGNWGRSGDGVDGVIGLRLSGESVSSGKDCPLERLRAGSGLGRAGSVGNEVRGVGGGRTNEVGSSDIESNGLELNVGTSTDGGTSVS